MVWRMWVRRTATLMRSVEEPDLNVEGWPRVGESLAVAVWMAETTLRSVQQTGPLQAKSRALRGLLSPQRSAVVHESRPVVHDSACRPRSSAVMPKLAWLHTGRAGTRIGYRRRMIGPAAAAMPGAEIKMRSILER
jgi:hypothetical protein